ncbi:unnamed protein product [Paramecium sonneborni]|uniref:Uncharacterized protein n=1 Tax=Paramecium sonneborni TaxID=65129 RepID=A0A8S1M0D5_9CILI|nr:unnamed protein product [Paramecium sonneborni]
MFFNFGRFFGFGMQSKLDALLKQDNLTLETILNEDDILQELKMSSSGKFADFIISHPDEFKKMIHYIIDDVQPEEEDKQKYIKFQFIISEVFGSENEKLINYLLDKPNENNQEEIQNPLEDQQIESQPTQEQGNKKQNYNPLIDEFLTVLQNDTLIVTTAGYINKIIGAIIHRRGYDFWEYITYNQTIIKLLFKHAELKHISEIIEKLLILDTNQEEENDNRQFIKERSELIIRTQKFLTNNSHSNVIVSNICDIFIELYKRVLISLETMPHLREIILNIPKPQYLMNLAIQTQNTSVYNLLNIQYEFYSKIEQLEDGKYAVDFQFLYSSLISLLPQALIQQDLFKVAFQTSNGDYQFPLGDAKLSLISFIIQLFQRQEIVEEINQFIIFQNILDLIIKYSYNNQLQILFEKLVTIIIQGNNSHLQNVFFQDQIIFKFLIKYNGIEGRKQKPAYQGILTKITNYLNSNINQSDQLQTSINLIMEEWKIYIDELSEVNQKELNWMCGVNPRIKEPINMESSSPFMPDPLIPYQGIRKIESNEENSINQDKNDINQVEQDDKQNNDIQSDKQDELHQPNEQEELHQPNEQEELHLPNEQEELHLPDEQDELHQPDKQDELHQPNEQEELHQPDRKDELHQPNDTDELHQIDHLPQSVDIPNTNQNAENLQEIVENQVNQTTEVITQELNQQQEKLNQEPEPTELIDQNQQPNQNLRQNDQENQQDLGEPEPQQQNKNYQQEPQTEPNVAQNALESNSQQQQQDEI